MATATITGGVSGLPTGEIVAQLIALERGPQIKLQSKLSKQKTANGSLQAMNSIMANLAAKAEALTKPGAFSPLTATSSLESVTITTKTGTSAGVLDVKVLNTAASHRTVAATTARGSDVVVPGGTNVTLTIGGVEKTLDTEDGTLDGLVRALNEAGTGVQATTVSLADGTRRLYITSGTSGADGQFTLTAENGDPLTLGQNVVTAGRDATIMVGDDTVTSKTNTFAGVIDGIDISITEAAVGKDATLTIGVDATKMTADIKALVDKMNEALAYADNAYGKNGTLERNSTIRSVRNDLAGTLFGSGLESLSRVGIEIDMYGKFTFDADTFTAAYAADPSATAAYFVKEGGGGFAQRVHDSAKIASDKYDGVLTNAIKGGGSQVTELEARIRDWDTRLAKRQSILERQFTGMEVALSKLQSQGNWLSSQVNALTANRY